MSKEALRQQGAAELGRQSQTLLTYLRGQPSERLRTDGMSFDPETQEVRNEPDRDFVA